MPHFPERKDSADLGCRTILVSSQRRPAGNACWSALVCTWTTSLSILDAAVSLGSRPKLVLKISKMINGFSFRPRLANACSPGCPAVLRLRTNANWLD